MLMNNEKHYNTISAYYKEKYNNKVCKVSLNAGFSCPNKDGRKGTGGCTYCSALGSGDFAGNVYEPLDIQFKHIKEIMTKKWPNALFIPYLQANSNTYKPLEELKKIYEPLLTIDENVIELSIATRCDCLEDEKIEYIASLNKIKPIQIELGLQTIHENTAKLINRGHTLDEFVSTVKKLREHNIEVVVHIINGLPYETKEMMIETIKFLNKLDIQGVKIHSLLILKGTKMGMDYINKPFPILNLNQYVDIVVSQIRSLNPNIIIHRLAADGVINDLIEPKWTIKKMVVMNEIDKEMRRLNAWQGDLIK
jgi:uncharacterized protein